MGAPARAAFAAHRAPRTAHRSAASLAQRAIGWGACVFLPAMMLVGHWGSTSQRDVWWPLDYARGYLAALEPNAVVFGGGDDTYFPLLYAHYVEGRRPDVTLFSYNDTLYPERVRLIQRLEAEGLRAKPPACVEWHRRRHEEYFCYLRDLLAQNIDWRPCYMVGPDTTMVDWNMRKTLAPYWRIQASNMGGWRLYRSALPALARGARPEHPAAITFGDLARFDGYDVEPFQREGVPMLRLRYYWDLLKPVPPEGLRAWVLFTDSHGNYRRRTDGRGPRFHNTHMLGQGGPLPPDGFPRRIRETFDVVVPPEELNHERRVRVALAEKAGFLTPTRDTGDHFVDVGSIGAHLLAGDQPPGARKDARWDGRGAPKGELWQHTPSL